MCSPISDGAAAVILFSEDAAREAGLSGPRIRASVIRSGNRHDHDDPLAGSTALAQKEAFERAGLGPDEIDCAEVHDASARPS
jgi:acetyl-CoA acetyltransferase